DHEPARHPRWRLSCSFSEPRMNERKSPAKPDERADNTNVDRKPGPVLQFALGTHHARGANAPAPTGPRAPMAAPDTRNAAVIPFARPRAIAAMPATFTPAVTAPTWGSKKSARSTPSAGVVGAPTWGSAAKQTAAPVLPLPAPAKTSPYAKDITPPIEATEVFEPTIPFEKDPFAHDVGTVASA